MAASRAIDVSVLCDKEFELSCAAAYEELENEISTIRELAAIDGLLHSSVVGRRYSDAVLARYDKVLGGFEAAFLAKWSETDRPLSEADYEWLRSKTMSCLETAAKDAQTRCHVLLYEPSLFFVGWWQRVGSVAVEKNQTMLKKLEILKLRKAVEGGRAVGASQAERSTELFDFWELLHPTVVTVSRRRFENGHYADAAEAAFKQLNEAVQMLVKEATGKECDGASLMQFAFSEKNPVLRLDDLGYETGRSIQKGYMQIFSGAMTGIRNPKAHANIEIDAPRAVHFLFLASLLFFKIDERKV